METLNRYFKQLTDFIAGMETSKKIAVMGTALVMVLGLVFGGIALSRRDYAPLMTNLSPEDSVNISRVLREKKIAFKMDADSKSIYVDPGMIDQLRLELAMSGQPQASVVGYEVFDKQSLGTTSFVQKVNQKRALEGEITRTINSIHGVKQSRVHLALPQKSTFVEDQKKPTASVVLDLEPGVQLTDKQITGIGHLVSKAVEGMDIGDVAIMDSLGKTLNRVDRDSLAAMSSTQLEYKTKVESDMEKRVENMLSKVVGEGKIVAKVNADLDFTQEAETQTTYDADASAVVSKEEMNNSSQGFKPAPTGVPGAQSNTPNGVMQANQPASQKTTDTNNTRTITNYNVPQTIKKVSKAPGSVKKLSVAIVMNGKTVESKDANGVVLAKVEPWSAEQIKEFEALVTSALGIDRKRGDVLEIKNMEFTPSDFSKAEEYLVQQQKSEQIRNAIKYGIAALTLFLFFFFVIRPFIKWMTQSSADSVESFLPQTLEELEKMHKSSPVLPGLEEVIPTFADAADPLKVEGDLIRDRIVALIQAHPHKAALVVKDWIHAPSLAQQTAVADATKKDDGASKTA